MNLEAQTWVEEKKKRKVYRFSLLDLGDRHGLRAGEIESHPIRSDEGSSLVGLGLEDVPEGEVEDVGAGVVLHHALAPLLVQLKGGKTKSENKEIVRGYDGS